MPTFHKVTLLITDFNGQPLGDLLGDFELGTDVFTRLIASQTTAIPNDEWTDDHPFNKRDQTAFTAKLNQMFPEKV